MINSTQPLSIPEVLGYLEKIDKSNPEAIGFLKKFTKLKKEEAEAFLKKLEDLNLLKLRLEHCVKIVDLMPENEDELNKIFTDVSLD